MQLSGSFHWSAVRVILLVPPLLPDEGHIRGCRIRFRHRHGNTEATPILRGGAKIFAACTKETAAVVIFSKRAFVHLFHRLAPLRVEQIFCIKHTRGGFLRQGHSQGNILLSFNGGGRNVIMFYNRCRQPIYNTDEKRKGIGYGRTRYAAGGCLYG